MITEMDKVTSTIPDLLNEHFLKWQLRQGDRKTLKEFAEFLGVGNSLLNMVINNHRPASESFIILCAQVLQDDRFYEISGVIPTNSPVYYIQKQFRKLSPEQQIAIKEQVEKYIIENQKE